MLVSSNWKAGGSVQNSFGTDGLIINSVGAPPEEGQEVAFHGASSGFREVQVRRTDVAAEIKAKDEQGNAIRLYMAGLIEVVARESKDRKKPVAQAGDSGAPLVSEVGGNYSLVGYLVCLRPQPVRSTTSEDVRSPGRYPV